MRLDGHLSGREDEFSLYSSNVFFISVFVYTCCGPHMFELHVLHSICQITWKLFEKSRLRVRSKYNAMFLLLLILIINININVIFVYMCTCH